MAETGAVCYPPGLLGVDEAITRLITLGRSSQPDIETVALAEAGGRVLAESVQAPMHVPPEANSAMDGVAFCFADLPATQVLRISQRIPAGQAPQALEPGTAARIFTGGIIPAGADTVVMQEHCEFTGDTVHLLKQPEAGANVRPAGQDLQQGQVMLEQGARLAPPMLGLLASAGITAVKVYRRLRVAILSTGDELLEPGEAWRSGAVYNSNRPMLAALLAGWGFEVIDLGRVADSRAATEQALQQALQSGADVVVSSGGVSVGEEDHVKAALQAAGQLDFWKVALKPGKPVAVGALGKAIFIGLPGNPQSVLVTALLLARPLLLARQGQGSVVVPAFTLRAGFARKKAGDRREYLRVRLQEGPAGPELCPHAQQSSGALFSAAWADGLALVEAGQTVAVGDYLPYQSFASFFMP